MLIYLYEKLQGREKKLNKTSDKPLRKYIMYVKKKQTKKLSLLPLKILFFIPH